MSVLSFPRIYFKGFMEWDPCTFNNNDWQKFPTYDGVHAALNWSFLAGEGITPENFYTTFRPWAIKLQPDDNPNDKPRGPRVPTEWNMFGTHSVLFTQYGDFTTTVTGGSYGYKQNVASDPLFGGLVAISGDSGSGAGRLVDTNPASFWSSQIYFGQIALGSGNCIISGPRNFRMHSRWLDLNRIYTTESALTQPAASVGACFQTCIPYDQVSWPDEGVSPLASKLQTACSGGIGLMIRFTAYVNLYFRNGLFNGIPQQPTTYTKLAELLEAAWAAWNQNGDISEFFSNPCYSHIVGSAGVWSPGEFASVPVGRYLAASSQVTAVAAPAAASARAATSAVPEHPRYQMVSADDAGEAEAAPAAAKELPTVTLGPVVASFDSGTKILSLDFNSTMPENGTPGAWPSDLKKTDFGPLDIGVAPVGGAFTSIVKIDYAQYAQEPYEASAGIIDLKIPHDKVSLLEGSDPLAIQVQGETALLEQTLSAQTDSRGIYLDQDAQTSFIVGTYNLGATSTNTNVLVAQYDANLALIPSTNGAPLVSFTTGDQTTVTSGGVTTDVTIVTTDETGVATIGIESVAPGFAVLTFHPFLGATVPPSALPPIALLGPDATINGSITYAFYTTVRVLPFDNAVPRQFVDLWNKTGDPDQAWSFIYDQILYVYDMLFNVMLEYVNLGSQAAVQQNISGIWTAISEEYFAESTYAMPITRDLSAGKRLTLQLWIYLVANNYNVPGFNVGSIPPGWNPPQQARPGQDSPVSEESRY